MKVIPILLLCISFLFGGWTHGGHTAVFIYQVEKDTVTLAFNLEIAALNHFDLSTVCDQFEVTTALCLSEYIEQNTEFKADGQALQFELQESKQDRYYFYLTMTASGTFDESSALVIDNQCFLEFDDRFINRIILRGANQKQRSYLLNKKNTQIKL